MSKFARDPDDLYDDDVVFVLQVNVRRNGSMSVAGGINNLTYALAVLDQAKQAVKDHHFRRQGELIIPAHDSVWPGLQKAGG